MRVLTTREKEAFETAWTFMERVGGLCARKGEDERFVENIVLIGKSGSTSDLPSKVKAAIYKMGGLRAVNAFFNGVRKQKNFPKFVKALMKKREQPRDYWSDGTLYYDAVGKHSPHIEIVDYDKKNS